MRMRSIDVALESLRYLSLTQGVDDPTPAPTEGQIAEAERLLGHPLPPSYREFMNLGGLLLRPGWDLYWVGGPEMARRNIVVANAVERAHETCPLPEHLIAFFDDDSGDQYCFDTRPREADAELAEDVEEGEYPIVLWDREKAADQADHETLFVVGDSFTGWIKWYIAEHF